MKGMQSRGGRWRRYGRAAQILIDNDDISDEELAKKADMKESVAKYCRVAFNEIRQVLLNKGWQPPSEPR
jgi:mannose/fructose/N-acetylgalactosamine-specific phosphotransferase system component IIB